MDMIVNLTLPTWACKLENKAHLNSLYKYKYSNLQHFPVGIHEYYTLGRG